MISCYHVITSTDGTKRPPALSAQPDSPVVEEQPSRFGSGLRRWITSRKSRELLAAQAAQPEPPSQ